MTAGVSIPSEGERTAGVVRAPARDARRGLALVVAAGLALATVAAFWPVGGHEFTNYDDPGYVFDRHVKPGVTLDGLRWALTADAMSNWHPLTWWSHMLDVELFGLEPGPHHLVSLGWHTLNVVLLFGVLRAMTRALWRSALVAALFALHPLHVESVAWVAERKDVLSTALLLGAIAAYVRWVRRPSLAGYLGLLLAFGLGLMTKPMLVTFPFLLMLLDVWPLARIPTWWSRAAGRLVVEKLPLFAMALAASAITIVVQQRAGAVRTSAEVPLPIRFGNAALAYVAYIRKMLWPVDLAPFYPLELSLSPWRVAASVAVLLLVTVMAMRALPRRPWVTIGWLWFLGTLVPVIGLVQVGLQSMADRYTYVPLIGLFVVAVWGSAELAQRWRLRPALQGMIALLVLVGCFAATRGQVAFWRDSLTLFERDLAVTGSNYIVEASLAAALAAEKRGVEAIARYRAALAHAPDFAQGHRKLAIALHEEGQLDEAIAAYREALRLDPEDPDAHDGLGVALWEQGRFDEAESHYREALRLRPDHVRARVHLGAALRRRGRPDEARAELEEAVRLDPMDAVAQNNFALGLADAGRHDEAIAHYREAIRIDPAYADPHYNLGNELAAGGLPADALAHFVEAERLGPASPDLLNNLALALADLGRDDEAAGRYRQALALDPRYLPARINLAVLLRRTGRLDEAAKELAAALAIDAASPDAHYAMGNVLAETGRLDESIGHYSEALRLDPSSARAYYARGIAYRRLGEVGFADADLARARALDPRIPE